MNHRFDTALTQVWSNQKRMAHESNLELSKDGIKISYRRYLTDSTPGFILVLWLVWARTYTGEEGVIANAVRSLVSLHGVPSDLLPLLFAILFLLATPIGVLINATGWFLLEWAQKLFEWWFCSCKWWFYWFKKEYDFDACKERLGINRKHWFERVRTAEAALVHDFPEKSNSIEAIRGIAILLRNLALMSIAGIYSFKPNYSQNAYFFIPISVFLLFMSAVVSFYFHVQTIRLADILHKREEAHLLRKNFRLDHGDGN